MNGLIIANRWRAGVGAEIVERNLDTECLEGFALGDGFVNVVDQRTFGDFQFERTGWQAGFSKALADDGRQVCLTKLAGREVDRNAQTGKAKVQPLPGLQTGRAQHPFADRQYEPGVFGNRNEFGWGDGAKLRIVPA